MSRQMTDTSISELGSARFGCPSIIAMGGRGRAEIPQASERRLAHSPEGSRKQPSTRSRPSPGCAGSAGSPPGPDPRPPRRNAGHASGPLTGGRSAATAHTPIVHGGRIKCIIVQLFHLPREENTGKTNDSNLTNAHRRRKFASSAGLDNIRACSRGGSRSQCYAIPKDDKDFIPLENPSCDSEPARKTQSVGSRPHTDAATHKYSRMKNLSGICKCLGSLALRAGTR